MIVVNSVDLLAQLFEFALRLGFAMRMSEATDKLPDNAAEAVDKTGILSCQCGNGLLFLQREIGWLLEKAPPQCPSLLGQGHKLRIVVALPTGLHLPAVGSQRFFEVPPDIFGRLEMIRLQSGMRPYRFDRFGEALRVIREGRGHMEAAVFDSLQKLPGVLPIL